MSASQPATNFVRYSNVYHPGTGRFFGNSPNIRQRWFRDTDLICARPLPIE